MIVHGQFYDGIVGKPDLDEALTHFGIKGMKWRRRKGKSKGGNRQNVIDEIKKGYTNKVAEIKKVYTNKVAEKQKRNAKYYAKKMAQDLADGKRKVYTSGKKDDYHNVYYDYDKGVARTWDASRHKDIEVPIALLNSEIRKNNSRKK